MIEHNFHHFQLKISLSFSDNDGICAAHWCRWKQNFWPLVQLICKGKYPKHERVVLNAPFFFHFRVYTCNSSLHCQLFLVIRSKSSFKALLNLAPTSFPTKGWSVLGPNFISYNKLNSFVLKNSPLLIVFLACSLFS